MKRLSKIGLILIIGIIGVQTSCTAPDGGSGNAYRCGGKQYDPVFDECSNDQIVRYCQGIKYDEETEECVSGQIQSKYGSGSGGSSSGRGVYLDLVNMVERLPNLPIVSIVVDPESMFSGSKALYKSGAGWDCNDNKPIIFRSDEEIPIYVDFYESGAVHKWSAPAGIKIHGGCSRNNDKKSVIVSFRNEYGQKNLNYPLFPSHPKLTRFKHFMLRNNGNNFTNDYIRDMLMTSLTEGLGIDYQKGRAVVVYYNGEYYGIHNLRERANNDYFETNYGLNDTDVDLIDANGEASEGSDEDFQRDVISWLGGKATLADSDLETLKQRIDVDNFTNHFQSRIFYIDGDWPGNNIKRWRHKNSSNPNLRKWRFLLYDADHGFGSWGIGSVCDNLDDVNRLSACGTNMMRHVTGQRPHDWANKPPSTLILSMLLTNEGYRHAFINRFSLLIATYLSSEKINARIDELMEPINGEIPHDQQRWRHKASTGGPGWEWIRGLSTIRTFAALRPALMQNEITEFFNLGAPVNLTLKISGSGKILVHDLPIPGASATFKAYPGVPVSIEAIGSSFKSWSDGSKERKRAIIVSAATTLEANF
jgi:hypothetical protein